MNRSEFLSTLLRLSRPVLAAGAQGALRETMTVEGHPEANMRPYTCFEAAGRLLCGIAPWLEHEAVDPVEAEEQHRARELARGLMSAQLDPASPDYGNFEKLLRPHCQNLVDAAFLALGVLRAPRELGEKLNARTRDHLVRVLRLTREIRPPENNWLLFSATIEAALKLLTGSYDNLRIDYAYRQFEAWYVGDGLYNDGRSFSLDYYNSFVIQPMLLELCGMFPELIAPEAAARTLARARRYGAILERAVAPDGSFFAVGRSIAYRCGAFHLLACLALREQLPDRLPPGQVRAALGAVIGKTLGENAFRPDGFLRIGLCGSQPGQGECYISTGSLYLASTAFLPLGLGKEAPFWTAPEEPWTQKRIWSGENLPADHRLEV